MENKINKHLIYRICFFIILFTIFNITIYGYFISKSAIIILNIIATILLILCNSKSKKRKYNILLTIGLIVILFLYVFRNDELNLNPIGCIWYIFIIFIAFILQFSSEWTKDFYPIINIFTIEHVIGTYFCYFFPSYYKENILPILSNNYGYSDLINQINGNMIAGFTSNYGINATYLIIGLIIIFCNTLQKEKINYWDIIKIIIVLFAVILTGKRGTLIFGILTMLITFITYNKDKIFKKIFKIILYAIFIFIAIAIVSQFMPGLNLVFNRIFDSDNLLNGRGFLYKNAWNLFINHPLFGIGWGNFKYYISNNFYLGQVNVHNMYLQLLCETGIIGTFIILFFIFFTLKLTYSLLKNNNYNEYKTEITTSFAIQLYLVLIGISSTPIYGVECLYPYLISAMIPYVIYLNSNTNNLRKVKKNESEN